MISDQQPNFFQQQTLPTILCCICGTAIPSNPSNMCVNCVRNQVDITDGIPKQLTIHHCKLCGRYLNPPNSWQRAELESRELLAFCIKRIKGLNKVKLIDAGFIWTEPHSRRLKVKLTIQKEVFTSTILQQTFVIEYVVHVQQCDQCVKLQSEHTWVASVQVRQRVDHKKTIYFLEQLILKHNAQQQAINIKEVADGLDFFFSHKSHALKFIDFLQNCVPIRYKSSEQLISHDIGNNSFNYKYSFSVEVAPVCRDDLICLPSKFAASTGNITPLVLCAKVSNMLHVLDATTGQVGEILAINFWKHPFRSIASAKQLVEFIILDINPLPSPPGRFQLAEAQVARASDLGRNDTQFYCRTHLGHLLKPGDSALGYDVATSNFPEDDLASFGSRRQLPDVILVRKIYPQAVRRSRVWKLKQLPKDEEMKPNDAHRAKQDYEQFLESLESDLDTRSRINIYKDRRAFVKTQREKEMDQMLDIGQKVVPETATLPAAGTEEEDPEQIRLEELLEDLSLSENASQAGDDEVVFDQDE